MVILEFPESRKVAKRVEDWKLRLIDLTRRNRAIYFQPTKTSHLTVASPDMETIFSRLVVRGKTWEILQPPLTKPDETPPRPRPPKNSEIVLGWSDANQLDRALRNLSRRSMSEYSERGIRVLYVAFGHLKWKEKETNQDALSPLLMTPVELFKESARGPFQIRVPPVEDVVLVNPALRLKLRYEHGVELPDLPEDEEQTPSTYLASVDKVVRELGWVVEPSAYLGLFSFSKLAIYQDLTDNLDRIVEHPLIKALAGVPIEGLIKKNLPKIEDLDTIVDPSKTFQILDADSSQQLCIQYALRGQSYVMHGPPGTGKSQTIANIISEHIAAGKSVLFVSEKMAALDVVYNRLKEKDLDEYCLELHSYKANKREVINELNRVLTEHLKAGRGMSDDEIDRLRRRRSQLNTYVDSLHKIRQPSNLSAYMVLSEISRLQSIPDIPSGYPSFETLDQNTIFNLEEKVRRLSNSWVVVEEGPSFPWMGCKVDGYSTGVRTEWVNQLTTLIDYVKQLQSEAFDYCDKLGIVAPKSLEGYDIIQKLVNIIDATPYPPPKWLQDTDLSKLRLETTQLSKEWSEYWAIRGELEKRYDNRFRALPKGTARVIEEAWSLAAEFMHPNTKGDGSFLVQFDNLRKCVGDTLSEIDVWGELYRNISERLGVSFEPHTVNIAKRLTRMVQLCESAKRPERSWLDKSTLDELRAYHEKAYANYKRRDELASKLSYYNEKVTGLDLQAMIDYLQGPGSSLLRYLRPSYYRVNNALKAVTRNGKIPQTILQDLRVAKELKEVSDIINSDQEEAKSKLGSYYREGNPDFEGAEEAIKVADEVLRLIVSSRAPKALRDNLCVGTKPKEELLIQSRNLSESLQNWSTALRHLRGIMPEILPGTKTSLVNLPFLELKEWATELDTRLNSLHEASLPALVTVTLAVPTTFNQLLSDLKKAERLQNFEEDEAGRAPQLRVEYGGLYKGISTDWVKVISAIDWTQTLLKALPPKPAASVIGFATNSSLERPKLAIEERLRQIYNLIAELNSRFKEPIWERRMQSLSPDEVLIASETLASRIDDLQAWVDFNETMSRLTEEGLGKLVAQLVEKRYNRDLLEDIYRKSIYNGLLGHIFEEDTTLRSFRARDHDQAVDDFRSLDTALIEETPKKVIEAANTNKPQGVFVEASDSEITILLREAAKKRRQMPLRHLFDKIPNLIRKLKPCLLMSPISVSQFIFPERLHFDLIVFDEASQICTQDAVGSIYRGDSLIVAGDNKQLPPTPFFQYVIDDEVEWEEAADNVGVFDSVLDECMGVGLPVSMLRWHYRSKHDSLINFSNKEFYNGKLILFPSAIHRGDGLGIEFVHVPDGVYDRGGARNNRREAEVVADIVFNHLIEQPEKSMGVMTFSISQMNTVKDEIEDRLAKNPEHEKLLQEDRLSGFFVKNLENVQGDERDVMVISVGYGYDKSGTMTMNFGPLNADGGERRLNVAVTRAREKVILVSSIKSNDIDLSSTKSIGARCLHDYLSYAEEVTRTDEIRVEKEEELSEIESEIIGEVRRLGYVAVPKVGESSLRVDIGVKTPENPDRFIMGIILDGEGYRSTTTARDRDRLRAQVLERMGWNIHRIWSPEWVQRRSTEVARLTEVLKSSENSKKRLEKLSIRSKSIVNKKVEHEKVTEMRSDKLPGSEPYRKASLTPEYTFEKRSSSQRGVLLKRYRLELRHLLPKLVKLEGPIHIDYSFKRLNKAMNLSPAPISFHKVYKETVEELTQKGKIERNGTFLWPKEVKSVKVRVPTDGPDSEIRPIEYVSSKEIQAAMFNVLIYSMGISQASLIEETANIFKSRHTTKTNRILELELKEMLDGGQIIQDGELLRVKKQI